MNDTNDLTPTQWRLISNQPEKGAWNMAVDQALLESIGSGASLPVLRLYAWNPPCFSLGYAQPIQDLDLNRLHHRGWDYVRRQTGGRAILHTDELTYSVLGPENEPRLHGGVLPSYQRLSTAILDALLRMGVPAEALPSESAGRRANPQAVCFEVPSSYEITVAGKKVVGSAQARKREGVLQHGTVPLYGDLTRIIDVIHFESDNDRQEARSRLLDKAANLEIILGKRVTWQQAAEAFVQAFSGTLALDFVHSQLTELELARAAELVETKYAHPTWNERI